MRIARIITALILTTSLIFMFAVDSFAGAVEIDLAPVIVTLSYAVTDPYIDIYEREYTVIDLMPGATYLDDLTAFYYDPEDPSRTTHYCDGFLIGFAKADDYSEVTLEYGYTYTFSGSFQYTQAQEVTHSMGFVLMNETGVDWFDFSTFTGDGIAVYFSERQRSGLTTVDFTVVFEMTKELPDDYLSKYIYPAVDYGTRFEGDFKIRNMSMKSVSEIGEKAFYQANIDAINSLEKTTEEQTLVINEVGENIVKSNEDVKNAIDNMWENEYEFTSGLLPDTGEAEEEVDSVLERFESIKGTMNILLESISTEDENPTILLPEMTIPILDVTFYEGGLFYPIDFLTGMSGKFTTPLLILQGVCRGAGMIGFVFFCIKQFNFGEWVR